MHKALSQRLTPLRLGMLGAFLVTCLVYAGVWSHEFVRWDDGMLIYENPAIRGITPNTIRWIFTHFDPELYIPLTFFTYQLNYLVGAINPTTYHLTNLFLHALNASLVVLLVQLLTGRMRVAVFCGLLFAVHPLHTEAVAWASARKDVLSTAFFLGSWILFLRYVDAGRPRTYAVSIVLHLCALLSKVVAATLPAVILLETLVFRPRDFKKTFTLMLPHLALSTVFVVVALFGKEALVVRTTLWQKLIMACLSTVFYLKQMLWPVKFSLLYPYAGDIAITNSDFFLPFALVLLLLVLAAFVWKKFPVITFVVFGYLGTLAPTFVNFAKGGDLDVYFASDRYAYIPSIFIFLGAALLLDRVSSFLEERGKLKKAPFGILAAVTVVVLSMLAFRQNRVWHDTKSLFEHVIDIYPEMSHVAYNNLCNMYRFRGDYAVALETCNKALAVRPHAKIWSNLGGVYRAMGMLDEARHAYKEALTLDYKNSGTYLGLALVEEQAKNLDQAERHYRTSIDLDPTAEEGYLNFGSLETKRGKWKEAAALFQKSIELNPFFVEAHHNLGVSLEMLGDREGATSSYREAVRLNPKYLSSRINLGVLLARMGDREGALKQFEAVLAYDPRNKTALSALEQLRR